MKGSSPAPTRARGEVVMGTSKVVLVFDEGTEDEIRIAVPRDIPTRTYLRCRYLADTMADLGEGGELPADFDDEEVFDVVATALGHDDLTTVREWGRGVCYGVASFLRIRSFGFRVTKPSSAASARLSSSPEPDGEAL